jgi:hypothetical protein
MGNYVKNNLISGETIEYETTYHWIIFVLQLEALLSLCSLHQLTDSQMSLLLPISG